MSVCSLDNYEKGWARFLQQNEIAYPSEYVIRIFKGEYPNLNLKKDSYVGKKICDIGCGDGRNIVLLKQQGFNAYGVETTKSITDKVSSNLNNCGILDSTIKVGTNDNLPFEANFFDYILSWNACYYMGQNEDFNLHVKEFARTLKSDGYLILSIPKKTCFIYHSSQMLKPGYQIIKNDPFNLRDGEVLRMFKDEAEIEKTFATEFKDFIFGSIEDNCFGFDYHWHIVVCKKK